MDKETKELFNALVEEMGGMEERINRRFDKIDRRLEQMDNRMDQMQHEINANKLDKETISIVMDYVKSVKKTSYC